MNLLQNNNLDINSLIQYKDESSKIKLNEELIEFPPIIPHRKINPINWLAKFPKQYKIDLKVIAELCRNNKINFEYNPLKYCNLIIYTKNPSSKVIIFNTAIIVSKKSIPCQILQKEYILKIYKTIYKHYINNNFE